MAIGIVLIGLIGISAGYTALNPSVIAKGLYIAQGASASIPALFVTGEYSLESFEPDYSTVNSTGYTIHIEENRSQVDPNSSSVEVKVMEEDQYNELSDIMFQFGDPDLDGGPNQDWNPSLDPRTRNAINEYDYIKYDNFYYNLSYEGPEELPGDEVSFDAELLDDRVTPGNPAEIQLELHVRSKDNITISTGAPYPFKTLSAISEDNRLCIWSEEYRKSEYVFGGCSKYGQVKLIGLMREHRPNETIKRNYSIRSQDVEGTGSYVIEDSVKYITKNDTKTLRYRLPFELSEIS